MNLKATRSSRVTLDADQTIESGEPIAVFFIIVSNAHSDAAEVDFQTGDGTATEFTVSVPANDSIVLDVPYIADKGIKLPSIGNANVIVSVFHSAPGV